MVRNDATLSLALQPYQRQCRLTGRAETCGIPSINHIRMSTSLFIFESLFLASGKFFAVCVEAVRPRGK